MQRTWTTRALLAWTAEHLEKQGVDSPRVSSEMLLSHVLGVPRLKLYMEPDRPASPQERDTFRGLVQRAAKHEPVDYLVGYTPFFALELNVSPAVLIPRPSTETIVEHVLQDIRQRDTGDTPISVADVCTGSGAIAIALAKNIPRSRIVATDISTDALEVARENAARHGMTDRIDFRHGDLLEPLGDERFDYLLSNPPYISDAEWQDVATNIRDYEPALALRAGEDGLDLVRPLINHSQKHVASDGKLLIEIAASQEQAVLDLAGHAGWRSAEVLPDHENLPRVLIAEQHNRAG